MLSARHYRWTVHNQLNLLAIEMEKPQFINRKFMEKYPKNILVHNFYVEPTK